MNKRFLVNGRVSETPVYWTAHYPDKVINQIDDNGEISEKWSNLPLENLEYWGLVSNLGCYGFYPQENICDMNGTKLRLQTNQLGRLSYKRTILASSEGWMHTKGAEIGFCEYSISLSFIPESKIVVTRQQEITGQALEEFELKTSD